MRILMIGGIQQKTASARFYDVAPKLINGFTRLGHTVLHLSDRDISRASNILRSRKLGIKKCNEALIAQVHNFEPHIIIFKHADIIQRETITRIREEYPHIKMAQVNVDALFNPDNVERIKKKSDLVDANYITTYGRALQKIKQAGKPVYYIPNPVDSSIECHKAFECDSHEHDLFLAYGNAIDGDPRKELSLFIKENLKDVRFKHCVAAEGTGLWGNAYFNALAKSYAGLNLSRTQEKDRIANEDDLFMYSSDRIAHYTGNGLLTFTDAQFHINSLFTEKEMIFYTSKQDLMEKISYYQENKAEGLKIAKAGWEKAHSSYTEQEVAQFIIQTLFDQKVTQKHWPKEAI